MKRAIIITVALFTMVLFMNPVTAQDHQHHEKHEQMMQMMEDPEMRAMMMERIAEEPGMPIGSPGMEQGFRKDPYNVILFDESGNQSVYAQY